MTLKEARSALAERAPLTPRQIEHLLVRGRREDWEALARQGYYDEVAALLSQPHPPGALTRESPLARGGVSVLVCGFFWPRRSRVVTDTARAQAALVGGAGLPALSSGAVSVSWGDGDVRPRSGEVFGWEGSDEARWRHGHLRLVAPLMHPLVGAAIAEALGWSQRALAGVLEGELYVDEAGRPRLLPWYAEEDAAARPKATARAAELGVALPERHLDEPWEGSWYVARSGARALLAQVGRLWPEEDPEGALVRVIPVVPMAQRPMVTMEGGHAMPGEMDRMLEAAWSLNRHMFYHVDAAPEAAPDPRLSGHLQTALARIVQAGGGDLGGWSDRRPHPALATELAGAPEPPDEAGDAASRRTLTGLWCVEGGSLLLAFARRLVWVDAEGQVLGSWPWEGSVVHVSAHPAVLVETYCAWHVLELESGRWLSGVTLGELVARGVLEEHVFPDTRLSNFESQYDDSNRWIVGVRSPDHRHLFQATSEMIGGVYRRAGYIHVAEAGDLGPMTWRGAEDEEEPAPLLGAALLARLAERSPNARQIVLDGVTFRLERGVGLGVSRESTIAFALRDDRWRVWLDDQVYDGDRLIARLGWVMALGAFSRDGGQLVVADNSHLHRIALDPEPRVLGHIELAPLGALLDEGGDA